MCWRIDSTGINFPMLNQTHPKLSYAMWDFLKRVIFKIWNNCPVAERFLVGQWLRGRLL